MGENMNQLPTAPTGAELTLTITPEQAEAFEKMAEIVRKVYERILEVFRQVAEAASKISINLVNAINKTAGNIMDALLFGANDNPKWWHLYKHAKKYRTRKKYRRRLMQQLLSKLRAANAQEA
jgi:hypothetical protein